MKSTCASSKKSSRKSNLPAEPEPRGRTAAILTTGCRLNQSESDALRQQFRRQGVTVVRNAGEADVCVINTCTVTAAADRSSTQLIRRACRLRPKPRVVVTGCLAERSPERIRSIAGVDEVWDNERKQREVGDCPPSPARSRALLKVQDGCSRNCAYCIVPVLRGMPRSIPAPEVCARFDQLVAGGFREVVLTGLNLGTYADGGVGLTGLVDSLLDRPGTTRIRLGSIEPDTIDVELQSLLTHPRLCPHLHIPLQSGDDTILKLMDRYYTTTDYARLLDRIAAVRPDVCMGADVIAGFPGESASSFDRTLAFLESLPLAYLHAFSFSPRPGTRAAVMTGSVPASTAKSRVRKLRLWSDQRRTLYQSRFVGTTRPAIVETSRTALTDNYLKLTLRCTQLRPGSLADVRIGQDDAGLSGCPC